MGCLTTSKKAKHKLDVLNIGVVKRSRAKCERHIVPIREMINVYNALLAIRETRGHFQGPGEDVRTVIRWMTHSNGICHTGFLTALTKHV